MKLTGTKLHRNSHSQAPGRKINLRMKQFKGPNAAQRDLGARAAATREDTFCIPFVSSMELSGRREGGHTHPHPCVHAGGTSSCWAAPQSCQQPKEVLLLWAGGTSRSRSHPHPFCQPFKHLLVTPGEPPAQEVMLL